MRVFEYFLSSVNDRPDEVHLVVSGDGDIYGDGLRALEEGWMRGVVGSESKFWCGMMHGEWVDLVHVRRCFQESRLLRNGGLLSNDVVHPALSLATLFDWLYGDYEEQFAMLSLSMFFQVMNCVDVQLPEVVSVGRDPSGRGATWVAPNFSFLVAVAAKAFSMLHKLDYTASPQQLSRFPVKKKYQWDMTCMWERNQRACTVANYRINEMQGWSPTFQFAATQPILAVQGYSEQSDGSVVKCEPVSFFPSYVKAACHPLREKD